MIVNPLLSSGMRYILILQVIFVSRVLTSLFDSLLIIFSVCGSYAI